MSEAAQGLVPLNPPQAEAVAHVNGPLLVFAGAGSGKTGTLAHRVARLLRELQAIGAQYLAGVEPALNTYRPQRRAFPTILLAELEQRGAGRRSERERP